MSLLAQAAADSRAIVEDAAGFSQLLRFTSPDDVALEVRGIFFDVAVPGLDIDTGQGITTRTVSARVSAGRFAEAGLELPAGITDSSRKPWRMECTDALGRARFFKVIECLPDSTLPVLIVRLETYAPY